MLPMTNRFALPRTGETSVDGIVFEIKKEIPIDTAKQDPAETIATRTE